MGDLTRTDTMGGTDLGATLSSGPFWIGMAGVACGLIAAEWLFCSTETGGKTGFCAIKVQDAPPVDGDNGDGTGVNGGG
jgi:hypothetical protein